MTTSFDRSRTPFPATSRYAVAVMHHFPDVCVVYSYRKERERDRKKEELYEEKESEDIELKSLDRARKGSTAVYVGRTCAIGCPLFP